MKLKKLLTLALAGFIFFSGASTAKAAELDLAWYAKQNPDVVKVLGNSPEMLKLHYELCGRKEARMANSHDTEAQLRRLFSAKEYGKLYPDIQKAFGENTEAMFQHYMAFGLLEGRRPSEKVSKATASSLKVAVEKAMKDAGLTVAPGSAQLVQIITGEAAAANISNTAVQQAMTKVTSVVEKAVTNTVQEVTNPAPAPKSSGSTQTSQKKVLKTVKAFTNLQYGDSSSVCSDIGSATPIGVTEGQGTESKPYLATVQNVDSHTNSAKGNSGHDYTTVIVAVPKEEGKNVLLMKIGETWTEMKASADYPASLLNGKDLDKYAVARASQSGLEDKYVEICLAASTSEADKKNGVYYKFTLDYKKVTIDLYLGAKWASDDNNSYTKIEMGQKTSKTATKGNGSKTNPYLIEGEVALTETTNNKDGQNNYWYCAGVASPGDDYNYKQFIYENNNWADRSSNVKQGDAATGSNRIYFGFGDDGNGGDVEFCVSKESSIGDSGKTTDTFYQFKLAKINNGQ